MAPVFVVLRDGSDLTIEDVAAHFHASGLARHKTPEVAQVVDALPRTPAGKIQKVPLRVLLTDPVRT